MNRVFEYLPRTPIQHTSDTHLRSWYCALACTLLVGLTGCGESDEDSPTAAAAAEPGYSVDHEVPSTPENVVWGWFPIDKEPVLRVAPGETVRIHTLTHAGATQEQEPISYLTEMGVPREEILDDVLAFWANRE